MSNQRNNTEESLYVTVEIPDERKRLTVFYEKNENERESIVLMVPKNEISFSHFLGLLISKFKLDSSCRSNIRVKTHDNGRRIKSLSNIYNNQILSFTISHLSDEDPDDVQEQKSLTRSEEFEEKLKKLQSNDQYLQLFNNSNENKNVFFNMVIKKLADKYGRYVIVGESYPYRCKLLLSDEDKDSRIWLYFIETISTSLEYKYDVIVECNDKSNYLGIKIDERNSNVLKIMDQQYQEDRNDIIALVSKVNEYYKTNFKTTSNHGLLDTSINLFGDLEKLKTSSQNRLFSKMLSSIDIVSNHFNIPTSLSKKLLFKSNWDEKATTCLHETSVKSNSYAHKVKDISLFKFNSLNIKVDDATEEECSICYCEYNSIEMMELICGHKYCIECMKQYSKTSLEDGNGGSNSIGCPTSNCVNKCIDEVTIETLSMAKAKLIGSKDLINDLIYSSSGINQCPVDGCGRIVMDIKSKNMNKYAPYITCDSHTLCLFCNKEGMHWPIRCNKPVYNESDLYSYKWIVANTTICGKCKFPIEKTQGCNHMKCSRCRYEFCYICGKSYQEHGTCVGSEIDEVRRNKTKIFFDTMTNDNITVDSSFMEEFFKGNFRTNDPLVKHIYQSLMTLITERHYVNKRHLLLLQNAVYFIHYYSKLEDGSEQLSALDSCQKTIRKLLRPVQTNGSTNSEGISSLKPLMGSDYGPKVRSLSVTVCLNGSKKQLFTLFVNSKFNDFKQVIVNQLNKSLNSDQVEYDSKKIRIYNLYGGQIKASNEIINNEPIFITSSIHEQWVEPQIPALSQEDIDAALKQIQDESEQEIQIGKNTFTTLQPKKEKTSDHVSKLKEKMDKQLQIQEKLKSDQQLNNYSNYRNSLVDIDNEEDNYEDYVDEDDEYDQQEEEDYDDEEYDDNDYDDEGDDYEDEINDELSKYNKGRFGRW